jgi:hypothetical protein
VEYRGVQYEVVQTANPTGYKWVVHLTTTRVKTGSSFSRAVAIVEAKRVIDKTVATPKTK